CPKCLRQLRHFGLDYEKPGTVHTCRACGSRTPEPDAGFICADCTKTSDTSRSSKKRWFSYELLPSGASALLSGKLRENEHDEFSRLVKQQLTVARTHNRPIVIARIDFDPTALMKEAGPAACTRFLRELLSFVSQRLSCADLVSMTNNGCLVCMPERKLSSAKHRLEQALRSFADTVKVRACLTTDFLTPEEAYALFPITSRPHAG